MNENDALFADDAETAEMRLVRERYLSTHALRPNEMFSEELLHLTNGRFNRRIRYMKHLLRRPLPVLGRIKPSTMDINTFHR